MGEYDRAAAAEDQNDLMAATRAAYRRRLAGERPASRVPPHLVAQRWIVGSGPDCDVRVTTDRFVAAKHAVLSLLADGSAMVEALPGGVQHTVLERAGARTAVGRPTPLERGDVVYVGVTALPWRR